MAIVLAIQAFLAAILALIGIALWKARRLILGSFTSPLLRLRGPPSRSWFLGNLKQVHQSEDQVIYDQWVEQYGPVFTYRGFLNSPYLFTTDTRAINHVLTHSAEYQKPAQAQRALARLLGQGVLVTEGEQHRQQRRIMNPAFGPSQIRELTETFLEKAMELRDVWAAELSAKGEPTRLNVIKGLSKMTLDVIGLAGFNYDFDSLNPNGKPNELAQAFEEIFRNPDKIPILLVLKNFIPILDTPLLRDGRGNRAQEAKKVMQRIGAQLIAEKKAAILRESSEKKDAGVGREKLQGRDLLTLLLKANMATDIPDSQRLSDDDVIAQVPTFLVAGHETTSTGTTWCLYALTQAPDVQKKLREELLTVETDTPTMDELMALPYLDMVVRESLRLYAPVPSTMRVATKDDIIPLDTPFVDRDGKVQDHVKIAAGNQVVIPILTLNRSKALWGEDAHEFRPERWENPPEAISSIPGVWGHLMTFLGGPRACIGYRFSIVEMKALIFTLVRAFEFELAVPPSEIKRAAGIVQRPMLRSQLELGNQMPLLVRRYNRA
ncbi:cytochrome P450 [Trametes cingulata]|nr:cytochrome P450 [Trametes cingulata]